MSEPVRAVLVGIGVVVALALIWLLAAPLLTIFAGLLVAALLDAIVRALGRLAPLPRPLLVIAVSLSIFLVVLAGLSEQEVLDEWRRYAWRSLAIIVCVVVANLLFGVLLFQQIRFGLNAESQLRIASHSLEKLALQDGLTGLANRRHFQEILGLEFSSGQPNMHPLSLIMIDIDFFKSYNDTYGHVAGDKCIVAVAECIRSNLNRTGDLAVRYGGEEMAVFLPYSEAHGAYQLAEKIRLTVLARALEQR